MADAIKSNIDQLRDVSIVAGLRPSDFALVASNVYVGEPTTPLDTYESFDEAIAGALLDAKVFATYSAIPEEWKQNDKQTIFNQLSERRHACVAYSPNNPTKKIAIMLLCIPHE
jgi:hypothetical protein